MSYLLGPFNTSLSALILHLKAGRNLAINACNGGVYELFLRLLKKDSSRTPWAKIGPHCSMRF
jgi:hypothetical protein